jgi:hypothetical protein
MLEGYKPIDFSSVFPPMELGQMRNRVGLSQAALNILANSKWSQAPISQLAISSGLKPGETPKREQTLWGRAVDLLSTPSYAIANAVDDAIAGHQSSDTDSVLEDAGQVVGGVVTGLGRGVGTGLRGAFAPSETAADPKDKIYLGDALIRFDTHMPAAEAVKPENREKVRERLMNKKINQFSDADENKYFYDFEKGIVEVTDEDIDSYFEDMRLYGLAASMVGDPLNFVTGAGKVGTLTKGAKGTSEIPEVTSGSKNIYEGFKNLPPEGAALNKGESLSINPGSMATGKKSPGSYRVTLPPGAIQNKIANPATGELITPPAWFDFPKSASDMGDVIRTERVSSVPVANVTDDLDDFLSTWKMSGEGSLAKTDRATKTREELFPVAKIPDAQMKAAQDFSNPLAVKKLTSDLLNRITVGGGFTNAVKRLSSNYPGVPFTRTVQLIEHLSTIPNFTKRLSLPAERKKILGAFHRVIRADAEAMKVAPKIKPAEDIINEATEVGPIALNNLVEGAKPKFTSKNPTRDAKIIDDVVKQFEPQLSLTQIPSGINNPAKYKAAMEKHGVLTGPKQANVWNALTSKYLVNVKSPARFSAALNILREVEERFIAMGHIPMSSTPKLGGSVPLRLSQVLDAIGPAAAALHPTLLTAILRGDKQAMLGIPAKALQKIEELKAGEAIVDASNVVKGVDAASKSIEDLIKGPLSAARTEEIVTIGSKVADDIARSAGGSPVAGKTAAAITKEEFIPRAPGDGFSVTNTTALISHPDVSPRLLARYSSAPSVAKAINKAIGGPTPRQLGTLWGPAAKVLEWSGARLNAAYKNADMRPVYLKNAATAKATVARRAEYLNLLAKQYNVNDADLWNDALKAAQGRLEAPPGSQAHELSKEIIKIMENLFGSSGLKSSIALENSVVGRSQLLMRELNTNLRRFGLGQYQFTKKGNYAEGVKWLNSWESWKIEQPLEFLFRVQNVVEHTVREKIMFDEIGARWGSTVKAGEFTHKVNHPRLAHLHFGKEAASQATQFIRNLRDISQPSSKAMQNFDKAVSKWKAAVTIYVPSHHVRNLIGDLYFNWLGGVNSSRPYGAALRVMQSQKGRYEGLAEMHTLTNPNALKAAIAGKAPSAIGKQTALTMKNGTNVTNDMVYVSAFQQGILPTTRVLEDIPDDVATGFEKFKPLGGKGQKAAHHISEGRDHYIRLAHYIDALKKSNKPFEQAVEDAAAVVRKWHPDGMDLTKFERNVMRRMFPFYSWTRKAFPLVVESLVATPGKVMAYPKAQYMLQNMLGIETGPMSDPFPYDQLFPDWIREKGIGPITAGDIPLIGGMFGAPDDYTVVNPGNPTMDLIAQLNNPGKMPMSMLNPAARIPIELATGREAQTGAPIDGITDTDYIAKQLPGVSHAGRLSGEFGVSDTTKENSQGFNFQNFWNMLTASGVQNTKPYIKSAEFDLREYLKSLKG